MNSSKKQQQSKLEKENTEHSIDVKCGAKLLALRHSPIGEESGAPEEISF